MSIADQHSVTVHGYLELTGLTLLYYDYFLTLPDEVSRIWSRPTSRAAIWFFVNRYIPFFGDIAVSVFSFTNLASSDKSCRAYGLARQLLLVANQVVVAFLLAMRTYALYGGSKRIAMFIGGVAAALAALTVWALLGQHSTTVPNVQGCHLATSFVTGVHLAVAWEAQAVFDVMVMVLTLIKTVQTRRELGLRLIGENWGLVDLVFRDGAVYFAVMAGANISNILTFYLANSILKGVLSTFAGCISVIMMSRLMLNLYGAATPVPTTRSSATRSDVFFTTRLEGGYGPGPTRTSVWPYGPSIPTAEEHHPAAHAGEADGQDRVSEETVRPAPQEIELVDINAAV